jgi:hypothetical protein
VRQLGAALALVVAVAGSCGDDEQYESSPTKIDFVVTGADDRRVAVRLGGGGTGGAVTVEESADEVRLTGSSLPSCPPNAFCTGLEIPVRLACPDRSPAEDAACALLVED